MSSNKSGRVLVAATLVAALFLAVPVEAIDGRGAPPGPLKRLAAWFAETWMSDGLAGGTDPAARTDDTGPASPTEEEEDEEDPEGCRGDYTACIDPNG